MSLCLTYAAHLPTTHSLTLAMRRAARKACGAWNNCHVEVIDGASEPEIAGESWHYETRCGRRIYHPSAYSRRGWSNMVYHCSTLRVVVGAEWFARG